MSNHKHRRHLEPVVEPAASPKASRHLNYRGDCRGSVGRVMGPNLLGERLTVVDEVYDPETDMTRLGLAYGIHELVRT